MINTFTHARRGFSFFPILKWLFFNAFACSTLYTDHFVTNNVNIYIFIRFYCFCDWILSLSFSTCLFKMRLRFITLINFILRILLLFRSFVWRGLRLIVSNTQIGFRSVDMGTNYFFFCQNLSMQGSFERHEERLSGRDGKNELPSGRLNVFFFSFEMPK